MRPKGGCSLWILARTRLRRHFIPDYARHGTRWVYGTLAHREDRVWIETADALGTASWLHFLDGLESFVPEPATAPRSKFTIRVARTTAKSLASSLPSQTAARTALRERKTEEEG